MSMETNILFMSRMFRDHSNPDISHLFEKENPTIGLDLDGVVASTRNRFIKEIEQTYNVNIKPNNHIGTDPRIPQIGKTYGELVQEIVHQDIDIYSDINPLPGSSKATNKLKEHYNIKIITHRVNEGWLSNQKREYMKDITIDWLDEHDIYYDEFVYPTPDAKSDIPADVYIDDRYENISDIVGNSNNIGIMYLRPHNADSVHWSSWLASSVNGANVDNIINQEETQWNIITEALTRLDK